MYKVNFVVLLLLIVCKALFAQSTYIPLDADKYHQIERYEIKQGALHTEYHSSVKPYLRKDVTNSLTTIDTSNLSSQDEFNLQYFKDDNAEWTADSAEYYNAKKPLLKHFYKNKADLYYVREKDFDLHINPVVYFGGGTEKSGRNLFINSRGVEVRGMIDDKVGFYSFITDNQFFFPDYVNKRVKKYSAVPGANFWKPFKEDGYDFFSARGYVTFNFTKHISTQFGHDKNVVGDGYRTLILSDYAGANPFWKLNLNIWKLNYQVIYNFMNTGQYIGPTQSVQNEKKYNVFHHLSVNVLKNLNIGVFETVTYGFDSTQTDAFDISYLNPVIFYRSIEGNLGSANGNAILGTNFKWNFLNHFSLYGQMVLDEFKLSEIKAGDGWWANKYGFQLGGKYIDAFGLNNLDLQGEMNMVRPFTYSHSASQTSYSHYGQSLAHPLGSNFQELVGIVRYQVSKRLFLSAKAIYANIGLDTLGSNWGQNILLPYTSREQTYGNEIGQGVNTDIYYLDLNISYMLKHNFFVDLKTVYRKEKSVVPELSTNTYYVSAAVRWNLAARNYEY
jgi:hypothetical protein